MGWGDWSDIDELTDAQRRRQGLIRRKVGRPRGSGRPTQAQRWVAARELYPGATLRFIAEREGVCCSAVRWWRVAAVAAGLESDRNWRKRGHSRGQKMAAGERGEGA